MKAELKTMDFFQLVDLGKKIELRIKELNNDARKQVEKMRDDAKVSGKKIMVKLPNRTKAGWFLWLNTLTATITYDDQNMERENISYPVFIKYLVKDSKAKKDKSVKQEKTITDKAVNE